MSSTTDTTKKIGSHTPQGDVLPINFLDRFYRPGSSLSGSHIDEATTIAAFSEDHHAVDKSINSVILTHAYIKTGMVDSATLALDDVAGLASLATKNLHAETFAFGFAAVLRTTYTFLMCHFSEWIF
jgi:hypothetical protein